MSITDSTKIHVLQIKTFDKKSYSWKVYLPKGVWKISIACKQITSSGLSSPVLQFNSSGDREVRIDVGIRKNPSGDWEIFAIVPPIERIFSLTPDHMFARARPPYEFHIAPGPGPGLYEPEKVIELVRLRAIGPGAQIPADSTDGLLVWLDRQEP